MRLFHENDVPYRFEDHGPKYLCETKDFRFGLVRLGPGQSQKKHVHRLMDEVFYVIEGKTDFYVNEEKYTVEKGQVIHIEPEDAHYIHNSYGEPVKMVLAATRTEIPDKVIL